MPFKSKKQRAWMYANHPKMAKRWSKHTPKGKHLPDHVEEDADLDTELASQSHEEERRAVHDYGEREKKAISPDLKKVFKHARGEEEEHEREFGQFAEGDSKTCPSCEEGHHERCRDESCDCCSGGASSPAPVTFIPNKHRYSRARKIHPKTNESRNIPRMSEVFVVEGSIENRPPPGSKPVSPTDYNKLGVIGQSLQQGLRSMQSAGTEYNAYSTPDGQKLAFPKETKPGQPPMKADDTKGVWTPVTGSAATGTPNGPFTPTTTMTH